jgi:hypothetical protein
MNKTEKVSSVQTIVTWLVEDKESCNRQYRWSKREIDHIKMGLSLMQESQRVAFRKRFSGYQIIKALDRDESLIESSPAGRPES